MAQQAQNKRKKGIGRTKRRAAKIAHYYEMVYPLRKLRRIWRDTGRVTDLRKWADAFQSPTGASGTGALIRLAKEKGFKP